ncbi:hypothetical protein BS50DRAFT_672283 [Corynespora cassiicola Philippines]|uniref:Lipocalin-like domain-containing protein n=1 Tax=Corynespora cassiicola Philippines TaxID=1448308 RepID=A0A2T2P6S9_CORCC|nr:hypothetical protein BS50DRAFT_672283 [Corynespora cassiicola Philippines]
MSIQHIPYTAPRTEFIEALEKNGGVIVTDFTDGVTLEQARKEVQPYLDVDEPDSQVGALNGGTKTCTRLIGRSPTVREKFFSDPLYQDMVSHFLNLTTTAWYGDEPSTNTCPPLLSIAITMDTRPGTKAQKLHRDDKNHHHRHHPASSYSPNRDMLLGLFVPGCDTRRENGATRVVPGSHLWGDEQPDFGDDGSKGVVDVCLKKGEAFMMLGSTYHGAGEYSLNEGSRMVHIMFCCSGNYRQEEISYLSYPVEDVKDTINGTIIPNGERGTGANPAGLIQYNELGYMSATIMSTTPEHRQGLNVSIPEVESQPDSDWAKVGRHTLCYAGPFYIKEIRTENSGLLIHGPLIVAQVPNYVGSEQERNYTILDGGNTLNISILAEDGVLGSLIWKRIIPNVQK